MYEKVGRSVYIYICVCLCMYSCMCAELGQSGIAIPFKSTFKTGGPDFIDFYCVAKSSRRPRRQRRRRWRRWKSATARARARTRAMAESRAREAQMLLCLLSHGILCWLEACSSSSKSTSSLEGGLVGWFVDDDYLLGCCVQQIVKMLLNVQIYFKRNLFIEPTDIQHTSKLCM